MQYIVKYKLFFHTFNKKIYDTIKIASGVAYFNAERNCMVHSQADAASDVKVMHKIGKIKQLFKVPLEVYDSEYIEVGATTLKILRCYID